MNLQAVKDEDIKFVLTTRDPKKWVDSWLFVADLCDIWRSRPFRWIKTIHDMLPFWEGAVEIIPTGGHPEGHLDRATLLRGYELHCDNVRKTIPQERLLEYNVKEGWEPLCEFLGVPIPDVPFPHINDRLKIWAAMMTLRMVTWIWPFVFILPLLLIGRIVSRVSRQGGKMKKT